MQDINLNAIFEQFDKVMKTLDCGDSSCLFKKKDRLGGMRTNGGCRCFSALAPSQQRAIVRLLRLIELAR